MSAGTAAVVLLAALWPQSPQARFDAGAAALRSGELETAEREFAAVVKLEPRNVGALGNLGVVYSRQGLPARAVEVWERALPLAPSDAGLRVNLGLAYLRLEKYAKAREVLESVTTAQGKELYATATLYAGDAARALKLLTQLPPAPGVLYALALAQLKLGHRAEAAATFEHLLDGTLKADQVRFLKGKAFYESGLFDESVAEFTAITSPTPGLALELGKVYVSLRDAAKAEEHLRAAVAEAPRESEANYFLGALLAQAGRAAEGLPFLDSAARARDDFWGAHFYRGRALLALGRAKEAVGELETARRLNAREPLIDFQLSRALAAAGRNGESKAAANRFKAAQAARRQAEQEALVLR